MSEVRIGSLLVCVLLLSGCMALPDTTLGHTCGIPHGVGCLSTQEVYDRTLAGDLPGLNQIDGGGAAAPSQERRVDPPIITDKQAHMLRTSALYAPPEELRIWVNHWRDSDGDLHEDSFIYVLVGEGQWLVRD
jgi:conjugal transfer pilus assembly protein TraV